MTDPSIDPICGKCTRHARWSICNLEGPDMAPIVRWFACGRHLHSVLVEGRRAVDAVQVYDLTDLPERS